MSVASNSSSTSSRGGTSGSSSKMSNLNVADVYDIAANIGKEFEVLIDSHGPEHVTPLMQKVISALEDLEKLAATRDVEKETIDSLKTTISHLEIEDTKKKEETQRNAKELEQIEEHYKQETRDLLSTVKRLQDENRKLASSLAKANERDSAFSEDESYFEVELVNRLQTVVEKQRGNIKKVEQANIEFKSDNEELRRQNEKLISCTRDLRRKLRTTQSQLHLLVDERAELTANVHDQQRELQQLQKQLGKATLECEELSQGSTSLKGKVVYDEKDPHRPRFSLPELRDILQERNALKARVSDLEDELAVFRPRPLTSSSVAASVASPSRLRLAASITASECDCSYHSRKDLDHDDSVECEEARESDEDPDLDPSELPVQGPLPQEPEDAPWKRNESGIRRFFSFITTRVSSVSQNLVASAEQELQSPFRIRAVTAASTTNQLSPR